MATEAVYLELGSKRVFACSLEWPGWCRSGKNEAEALAALAGYAERYAAVPRTAGMAFPAAESEPRPTFEVVERITGTRGYTDFGAPGEIAARDHEPLGTAEADRLAALVAAAWTVLERIAATTPRELRRGPRGGGRDRDKMLEHVLGGETQYARKVGVKHRQPALDDAAGIAALRRDILAALRAPSTSEVPEKAWPARYAARRIAWHVLDHAWEMEDRSDPAATDER